MKEIFQSFFETSKDRIKSPFIGSYVTAFIIYNWRPFFLLIFSDAKIEDKIVVINHEYCNKAAILYPLSIALFYIIVLPYINLAFDNFLAYSNKMKDEKEKDGEINKLQQKKTVAKLEREIAEERAGTSEISELKNQIERLNAENQKLLDQNKETFDRYNKTSEMALVNEKDLKEKIRKLENDNEEINKQLEKLKDKELNITYVTNKLSEDDKKYFITYGNYKIKKLSSLRLNYQAIEAFEKYGLIQKITDEESTPELTEFGKVIYEYLKK